MCIREYLFTMTLTGGLRPHGLPSVARAVNGLPWLSARDVVCKFKPEHMACVIPKGGGADGCGVGGDHGSGFLCIRVGMLFQSISALALNVRWTFVTSRSFVVCSSGDLDFFCVVSWMCLLRCCLRLSSLMVDV